MSSPRRTITHMAHEHLSPDVLLGVKLSAICARNSLTSDPTPVIAELLETAGARTNILAMEVGTWIGFYENDDDKHALVEALREIPGVEPWILVGQQRLGATMHGTRDYRSEDETAMLAPDE